MSKEQLRAKYPELAAFKDDMAANFGALVGIDIDEDDKKTVIVKWGVDWGETVSFPADPMSTPSGNGCALWVAI